ncbi:hypothetical protein ACQP2P_34080 [Dactylosporangium sp. CA-139114]|uniref:hypothetical protein n=1 Tax=Dactylosporangium sp. CA-139114 TaxID=3239931 RepID=UPI003D96B1A8
MTAGVVRVPGWVRWTALAVAVLAALAALAAITANRIRSGPGRPAEGLFVPPAGIEALADQRWENGRSFDHGPLAVRRWQKVERPRDELEQSITVHRSGYAALYGFSASDPRINDREDFGDENVHDAPLAVGVEADQALIYCRGIPQPGRRDSCAGWVYWARYGSYTVKMCYREPGLDAGRFSRIAGQFDAKIARFLAG